MIMNTQISFFARRVLGRNNQFILFADGREFAMVLANFNSTWEVSMIGADGKRNGFNIVDTLSSRDAAFQSAKAIWLAAQADSPVEMQG
jgi:hypothetical protein